MPPEGLTETPFGLRFYVPEMHTLFEVVDLHRRSGDLLGELTVRCNIEGVRAQLDGNRLRQGNINFSSIVTRGQWAKALEGLMPKELEVKMEWSQLIERCAQAVLDHERNGAIHGHELVGKRLGPGGRPWAAWPLLPHGDCATLFARGGAGKTSLVATMAFSMALGKSLIPGIRVDRPYRVALLDWETNTETAEDLWGLIAESHGVKVPEGIWYEPMEEPLERALPKVATILERSRADCVIIDSVTMSLLSSGEHSDPSEGITRVYQSLRRLRTWGLLIDHVSSGDLRSKKVAMKAYGSIFKLNLARHAVALHIGNRVGDTSQAFLLCPKSNVARDQWAMPGTISRSDTELRWGFGDQDYDLYDRLMRQSDGEDGAGDLPEEHNATPRQADLYLSLLYNSFPTGMTIEQLREETHSSSTTFVRKTMARLKDDGLAVAVSITGSKEKNWVLTETGINFVVAKQPT